MSFFAEFDNLLGKRKVLKEKELSYKRNKTKAVDMEEDLLNAETKFYNEEDDEYKKDKKKYINDELSYMNRIKTFNIWTKKPIHLCSIILARNGYMCEDENTIKCEMCGCKYIYEKDKYSMYTQINDLCLLHEDNCPWKNRLMDLSLFKLDENSLKREELLKEYEANVNILKEALYEIPLVNIKKTIKNLQIIIKRHLENDVVAAKKYSIFNWYMNFFKNQFSSIFSKNENVIKKGIEKMKTHYKDYEKYIIDLDFINNLQFDIYEENNYVNILCDEAFALKDEEEDVDMYLKIVSKMRTREYEEINIFKLLALFGWTYKADSVDMNNNFTQILHCKYCFREVKISNFSSYLTRDHKLMLFKEINSALETRELFCDILNKKKRLQELLEKEKNTKLHNSESMGEASCDNSSGDEKASKILEHLTSFLNDCTKNNSIINSFQNILNTNPSFNYDGLFNETSGCKNPAISKEHLNTNRENIEEKTIVVNGELEQEKGASKTNDAEESAFKWEKKKLVLIKKNKDFFKDRNHSNTNSVINSSKRKNYLFAKKIKKKESNSNKSSSLFKENENQDKEILEKNCLTKVCMEISNYLKDETLFLKTLYNYNVLIDSNFFKLDENNTYEENKKCFQNIRLFDVIENHWMYCPYLTDDLYSFSKITKLFFELLISEFQRRYIFKK